MTKKKNKNCHNRKNNEGLLYEMSATFICAYCLHEFPMSEKTRDHVLPKSRGGTSDPDNIVLACHHCNEEKGALTAEEYAEWKRLNFIRCGGLTQRVH